MMLLDQPFQLELIALNRLPGIRCNMYDVGCNHLAGRINNRDLTAGTEAGIESERDHTLHRGLEQKLPQIRGEHRNSLLGGLFC